MNKICSILLLSIAGLLSGCGGGDVSAVDNVSATASIQRADVVLMQVPTAISVSPGTKSLITRLEVKCDAPWLNFCPTVVPGGEIHVYSPIPLLDMAMNYNGSRVSVSISEEFDRNGDLFYRLSPFFFTYSESGYIDIEAFISPYANGGETATITVLVADASVDKTLELVANTATIAVATIPHLTPVEVYGGSSFEEVGNGTFGEVASFSVKCPDTAQLGCTFLEFALGLYELEPDTFVQVYVNSALYAEYESSEEYFFPYIGRNMYRGETIRVRVLAVMDEGYVEVTGIRTLSGDQEVLPKIENTGCNTILSQGTDGGESC